MILSENLWKYKKPSGNSNLKRLQRTPLYNVENWSGLIENKFFAVLSKYKAFFFMAVLLLAQFSLYDFNIDEYTNMDYHGAPVSFVK